MEYQVRKAVHEDFENILKLYENARAFMAAHGNPHQWGKTEPSKALLSSYLQEKVLYILENDTGIHGAFMFKIFVDPTYQVIEKGQWRSHEPYGVIHSVAGDGSGGILAAAVSFAETRIRHLRMDTHEKNLPMQKALTRQGFSYCGIIYTAQGEERLAYEKEN